MLSIPHAWRLAWSRSPEVAKRLSARGRPGLGAGFAVATEVSPKAASDSSALVRHAAQLAAPRGAARQINGLVGAERARGFRFVPEGPIFAAGHRRVADRLFPVPVVADITRFGEQIHHVAEVEQIPHVRENRGVEPAQTQALVESHIDILRP